MYFISILFPIT